MTFRARSQPTHGRSHLPKEHQSSEDSLNVVIITMVPAAAVIAKGSVASTSFLNKKVILFCAHKSSLLLSVLTISLEPRTLLSRCNITELNTFALRREGTPCEEIDFIS